MINSATILVIRDGVEGALEVLMVKRHHNIVFAGGAYVFPGGKVDASDLDSNITGDFDQFIHTAFREVFEESGLIIATQNGHEIDASVQKTISDQYRERFLNNDIDISQFLKSTDVQINLDTIKPFARWVTPRIYPKRYDTRFFLAKAPVSQIASPDHGEVVGLSWVKPLDFIDKYKEHMMFPTIMNLKLLAQSSTVAEAFMQAKGRKIITVEPEVINGIRTIDPAAGYGEVDQSNMHPGAKNIS